MRSVQSFTVNFRLRWTGAVKSGFVSPVSSGQSLNAAASVMIAMSTEFFYAWQWAKCFCGFYHLTALAGKYHFWTHFADEKTEGERGRAKFHS